MKPKYTHYHIILRLLDIGTCIEYFVIRDSTIEGFQMSAKFAYTFSHQFCGFQIDGHNDYDKNLQ